MGVTSGIENETTIAVDSSDRGKVQHSPDPMAIKNFDEALAAQRDSSTVPGLDAARVRELETLRADVAESIPALQDEVDSYAWVIGFGGGTLPPGYLDALAELSERKGVLEDIDALLEAENPILGIDAELARLDEREAELSADVDGRSPPRDYSNSPPSSGEALNDNHRDAGLAELEEIDARRTELTRARADAEQDLREADTRAGITVAHANSLLRVDELRSSTDADGDPLKPDNTLYFGADEALGTVYLNDDARQVIEFYAEKYDIPPALLAGVVAAELDFDYELKNDVRDGVARGGVDLPSFRGFDDSIGATNVHRPTLETAQAYLVENELPGADTASIYTPSDDRRRATFSGSVEAAAIVTSMYDHAYGGAETPEDMAVVWAAYRSGVGGFDRPAGEGGFTSISDFQNNQANGASAEFSIGNNAYMSEPLFEFLAEQYG